MARERLVETGVLEPIGSQTLGVAGMPMGSPGMEQTSGAKDEIIVWAFDTAAYFTGRQYGRRPFMAHISPSKTVA